MKKILCFGDSNTFGFNPHNGLRYSKEVRWTGILQSLCGTDYKIIEAGCNNRTCFRNNPEGKIYTGHQALPDYLIEKTDIIIIGLGSNDLQRQYKTSLLELEYGLEAMVKLVKTTLPNSKLIILSPSIISESVLKAKIFSFLFDKESVNKSKQLGDIYERVAHKMDCDFINLAKIAQPSDIDGLHYEPCTHKIIAEEIYKLISE